MELGRGVCVCIPAFNLKARWSEKFIEKGKATVMGVGLSKVEM